MHVIVGLLILGGSMAAAHRFASATFGGLFHLGSLLLLLLAPIGAALVAYDFRAFGATFRIALRALFARGGEARLLEELYAFGRAVRSGRTAEAAAILEQTDEPLLRDAGPLVLARTAGGDVAETVQTVAYARMVSLRSAEEVLRTLSRAAPSFGMVGTIMGLTEVLTHLSDFDKLGAGMALAIMTTLYGLVLAQGVYVPLTASVSELGQRTATSAEVLARGLAAIAEGRSLYELRLVSGGAQPPGNGAAEREAV